MNLLSSTYQMQILSFPGTAITILSHFVSWTTWLGNCQVGDPKIKLDRYMNCTPFTARVLLTIASSQGNCLSLSFFWLSLGMTLDLRRVVSFASTLRKPLVSMGLLNIARIIHCLSWLKPGKISKRNFCLFVSTNSVVRSWPNGKLIFRALQKKKKKILMDIK